jgi:hypothetical protein
MWGSSGTARPWAFGFCFWRSSMGASHPVGVYRLLLPDHCGDGGFLEYEPLVGF